MFSPSRFVSRSLLLNGLFAFEGASMFILDVTVAATLGLGAQSDILYAAWSLPQTIGRGMFQSLTNSFMGMFSKNEDTTLLFRQAITVITLLSIIAATAMTLTARWWLPLSMLGADSLTWLKGILPASILAWLIAFLGPAETFRAIYYRADSLVLPSASRILGTMVAVGIILLTRGEKEPVLVAWAVVSGAAVETVIGFVGFKWLLNFRYRISWPDSTTLGEMIRIVGLPLTGQGIRVIAGVAERALASYLGPGALTAVTFATRLVTTLDRFVFRGFLIATIQTFHNPMKPDYNSRLRLVALLALPIGVVFAFFSPQLIEAAFGRGRFTARDVEKVAITIQTYSLAIIGLALTSIPLGLAYARRQSIVVLGFFTLTSALQIALEFFFIQAGYNLRSFGIALTITTFFSLLWLARRSGSGFQLWTWHDTAMFAGLTAFVSVGAYVFRTFITPISSRPWSAWLELIAGGMAILLLTITGAWLVRVPEINQLNRLSKLKRKSAGI